ncbi:MULTISPECIES: hypothetical protein [Myxococcus]|uniref:hypothetical protein n=1 Tax=Myxococcus TaxID=32 RepID=UPI0011420A8E|nr:MULTISPECIES: hypothetical protein [Myxococcus]NOK05793.1 hypothetical protein [Myxococcus xanthus]
MRWMLLMLVVMAGCAGSQQAPDSDRVLLVTKGCSAAAAKKVAANAEASTWPSSETQCLQDLWMADCAGEQSRNPDAALEMQDRVRHLCGASLTARVLDVYDSGPPSFP